MEKLTCTRREAAKAVGVSIATIDRLIREGKMPALRISPRRIVIPVVELEKWVHEQILHHT